MARSLARNTKLFASTLVMDTSGGGTLFNVANADTTNTWEIKVLDGYSFSQDVASQEIGVSEADVESTCSGIGGLARGTQSFNTALNPVDVSFGTYVRPYDNGSTADCVERALWGSAMGTLAGFSASPSGTPPAVADNATYSSSATQMTFGLNTSNNNELMPLTLFFVLENTCYVIEDFNVGTAEVDFSIDGIATINWTGNGSRVNENQEVWAWFSVDTDPGYLTEGTDYEGVPTTTTNTFLRNKLSTLELSNNEGSATGDDADTIGVSGVVGKVITITGTITTDVYAGGRIRNIDRTPDEWAQIVENTTNTITVSNGDDLANWVDGDNLQIYLPTSHSEISYCVPITGATLTLENNLTYLTPEELAIVNLPLAGFAGNRVTSGSFTAYLNTGAQGTGGLLQDLLAKIEDSVTTDYALTFHMGGDSTTSPRVDFDIPHAQVGVPTTNVEDIISTEI